MHGHIRNSLFCLEDLALRKRHEDAISKLSPEFQTSWIPLALVRRLLVRYLKHIYPIPETSIQFPHSYRSTSCPDLSLIQVDYEQ